MTLGNKNCFGEMWNKLRECEECKVQQSCKKKFWEEYVKRGEIRV